MELIDLSVNASNICHKNIGGKGLCLIKLKNQGFDVPNGFIVSVNFFEKYIAKIGIEEKFNYLSNLLITSSEKSKIKLALKEIRNYIISTKIPEDIGNEIINRFKKDNYKFVAVRSSTVFEDSNDSSWAGQLESYLNVTSKNLLQKIRECWASAFSTRIVSYLSHKRVENFNILPAVIVQKMINSEKSGVSFSVNPVTKNKSQIIIEAGYGLGEAVVSGVIKPGNYIIDKNKLEILELNLNKQNKKLCRIDSGGNKWKLLEKNEQDKQILSNYQIIELAKLVIKIEKYFKYPCDVEWAIEKERIYFLQARPITTLF